MIVATLDQKGFTHYSMDTYKIIELAKQLSNIQFQAYEFMNLYSAPTDKQKYQELVDLCWKLIPVELKETIKEYPEICEVADEEFNCHIVTEACFRHLGVTW